MAGSIEPQRVPIISPSIGVKPIVLVSATPARTALAEQPLPRWQITSRASSRLSSSVARREQ